MSHQKTYLHHFRFSRSVTHSILAVIIAALCSGCGTIIGRSGVRNVVYQEKIPDCYPATYCDGVLIGQSFTTNKNPNASVGMRCIVCVGSVVDLPVSIVFDTILLPFDASKSSVQKTPTPNTLNPTGSHNLKPDPEKHITDPEEIRRLDELTRVR